MRSGATMVFSGTQADKLKIVHSCLCNGLNYFGAYGIELDYDDAEYKAAKASLEAKKADGTWVSEFDLSEICYEDVLSEMIAMGKSLVVRDLEEADGDDESDNGPVIGTLNLETIEAHWAAISATHMNDMLSENDDANTADCILQVLFFGKEVYG